LLLHIQQSLENVWLSSLWHSCLVVNGQADLSCTGSCTYHQLCPGCTGVVIILCTLCCSLDMPLQHTFSKCGMQLTCLNVGVQEQRACPLVSCSCLVLLGITCYCILLPGNCWVSKKPCIHHITVSCARLAQEPSFCVKRQVHATFESHQVALLCGPAALCTCLNNL
jgi:hypothetical protein